MKRIRMIAPRRVVVAVFVIALSMTGGAVAVIAATPQPAIQTFTPRSANQITNLDVLRQQIRNYYGDPLGRASSTRRATTRTRRRALPSADPSG